MTGLYHPYIFANHSAYIGYLHESRIPKSSDDTVSFSQCRRRYHKCGILHLPFKAHAICRSPGLLREGILRKATFTPFQSISLWILILTLLSKIMHLSGTVNNSLPNAYILKSYSFLNKEIAQMIHITERTVKWHASKVYEKLQVTSRMEAVTEARKMGIL